VALASHELRPLPLRQPAGRPQLKRDPLGGAATESNSAATESHAKGSSDLHPSADRLILQGCGSGTRACGGEGLRRQRPRGMGP
jgi:hypothetical protein